jgi:hypothetical protein
MNLEAARNEFPRPGIWIYSQGKEREETCREGGVLFLASKDLVTGREIWLPTGNRVSRAPTVTRVTEQTISILFENFEFELKKLDK